MKRGGGVNLKSKLTINNSPLNKTNAVDSDEGENLSKLQDQVAKLS
jgi:hypothetical protein